MDLKLTREKLVQLEEKADQLQKQGKFGESLDVLEEILNLKRNAYGEDTEEYYKTCDKLCELCNLIAMICLQKEKFEASIDFLKKAEVLCQNSFHYKAITFNNMACYYRRTAKLRTALNYLQKALDIEIRMENPQSLADTHLNLCAVLSQLDKHSEALEHVLISIVLLQDEYLSIVVAKQKNQEQEGNQSQTNNEQNQSQDPNQSQASKKGSSAEDRVAVLAIAYHNMGVELEYLKRYEEAIQTYHKAVKFAKTNLGEQHQLVDNLTKVLEAAYDQIEAQQRKEANKKNGKFSQPSKNQTNQKVNKVQGLYATQNNGSQKKYQTSNNFRQKPQNSGNKGPMGSDAIRGNRPYTQQEDSYSLNQRGDQRQDYLQEDQNNLNNNQNEQQQENFNEEQQ